MERRGRRVPIAWRFLKICYKINAFLTYLSLFIISSYIYIVFKREETQVYKVQDKLLHSDAQENG